MDNCNVEEFSPPELEAIESTTREVGRWIFDHLRVQQPGVLDRRWWEDRIMAWAMEDESVKVQMFRFVDVLPMLGTSEAVVRHLHEYFEDVARQLPSAARLGLHAAAPDSLVGRALAIAARRNVMAHARRFIAGTTAEEVLAAALRQRKLGRAFTLDILGEAVISEREADHYLNAYIQLIERIAPQVNAWPEVPQVDRGVLGELPRVNVSIKLSALDSQFDAIDPEGSYVRATRRLRELLRVARKHRAFVNIDMESYATKTLTLDIFKRLLMEDEFRDVGDVGIVIQAYLKDSAQDLAGLQQWARDRGKPVWVRLVKGAYWDYETVHARALGWPVPVFERKWQTDANFERLVRYLFTHHDVLRPALGTHNIRSIAHGIAVARHLGMPKNAFELQMLYGMGDPEKQVLVDMGHRVRIYMPYGELIPGMAYLVRRLLENTSNDSFLRASFTEHVSPEKLLMNPEEVGQQEEAATRSDLVEQTAAIPAVPQGEPSDGAATVSADATAGATGGNLARAPRLVDFRNEPPTDFAVEANRRRMREAIDRVRSALGGFEPLVIGGEQVETAERITSINPSRNEEVIGYAASATAEQAAAAVEAARAALEEWSQTAWTARTQRLRQLARCLQRDRFELAAWIVLECGKPWREADADVAEAIDFCNYYATLAEQRLRGYRMDRPGEENRLEYLPRGVTAVIAPWNFPLAILTGMTAAALVTGNTVVMKPAEQTPLVAAQLMKRLIECDFPAGVVNYLPGVGETAGAALVEHPSVALIAFTGSRQVGMAIHRRAAEVSGTACAMVKYVIAEMGGKNAILIDDDADLDEAVAGVVASAFGYQGQKCSACSRAVVVDRLYDAFLDRLIEAAKSLPIGPADLPGTRVGPLVDADALAKVRRYIDIGRREGREVLSVDVGELAQQGFFIGPHIFTEIEAQACLAQEEVFGPVLAVIRASDFEEGLRIVNQTEYGLTAGVYSRSPAHLRQAARQILAGNIYLNRPITGALVGHQPFGGFKMSGIGSKAGGPDYLLQFVLPRTVTENTMRRGFSPDALAQAQKRLTQKRLSTPPATELPSMSHVESARFKAAEARGSSPEGSPSGDSRSEESASDENRLRMTDAEPDDGER